MEKLLITEVINRTLNKLEERGISESYKVQFKRMYVRFLEFSKEKNQLYFSVELTDLFLLERYNIDVGKFINQTNYRETKNQLRVHRLINCLNDIALTNTIYLRRKGKLARKN